MQHTERSLAGLLYHGAAIEPGAVAVREGPRVLTYADLIRKVEGLANALQQQLPLRIARVALCAVNSTEHLVAYLAILMARHIWIPVNPKNGRALNTAILDKARPDLLIVDRSSVDEAPSSPRALMLEDLYEHAGREAAGFVVQRAADSDIAAIKFTGGTSGEPKGVLQTHGNMLAVIENLQAFYRFERSDCNLAVAPLTHGSSHFVLPVLAAGGRHRFPESLAPQHILSSLGDGTTVTFMPPTLIYRLLCSGDPRPDLFRDLRHLTYGAAPMPPERIVAAQGAFGPRLSTVYGQTEAPMTISALGTGEMARPELQLSVGKACANCRIRIVDDDRRDLPSGEIGKVEVKSPIVMPGYLDNPGLSAAAVRDGWLDTGDLGSLDDNAYLTLAGRATELIITGGFNVYPAEIENVLAEAPGVGECCVFGVADPYWGERIEVAVTPRKGETIVPQRVLEFVRQRLGSVRTPKALHVTAALPRNAVGKVVRRNLPEYLGTPRHEAKNDER